MARSRFRTRYGRPRRKLPFRSRPARRHHGFLTRFHRPVNAGRTTSGHRRQRIAAPHPTKLIRAAHPGQVIHRKTRAKTRAVAGHRHLSATARAHLSAARRGKHHPHRGHAVSAATRAKIAASVSKRLRGRPHPHRGHAMSNTAREKISRALKGKPHRRTSRKRR